MGILRIIGRSSTVMYGDAVEDKHQIAWTKDNIHQVALAEKTFKEYTNKGWLAIGEVSGKKEQIFSFNPDLAEIILVPLVEGG